MNLCIFGKDVSTFGRIVQPHLAIVIHVWYIEQSFRDSIRVEFDENYIHCLRIFLTQQFPGLDHSGLFNVGNPCMLRIITVVSKVVWEVSWLAGIPTISSSMNRRITCCVPAGRRRYDRSAMKAASHWYGASLQIAALEAYDSIRTDLTGHRSKMEVACCQASLPTYAIQFSRNLNGGKVRHVWNISPVVLERAGNVTIVAIWSSLATSTIATTGRTYRVNGPLTKS